jgi:hypothetical protein
VLTASANAKKASAAELEMMNTAAARAALAQLYPGEARIWGERPWEDPGHTTFTFFDKWEESLRALMKSGKYQRIDALARASYWGGDGEVVVLGRTATRVDLLSTTSMRTRRLAAAEEARLRQLLDEISPADLDNYDTGSADGVQFEYVFLTPDGGRRVFMNNPPSDERDPYGRLVAGLAALAPGK